MLEKTETAILRLLEEDGRLSYAELGEKVGLSKSPCWSRVRDLEQRGVIRRYRAEIDPAAVGLELTPEAIRAEAEGADYVGAGPVYATTSKVDTMIAKQEKMVDSKMNCKKI